MLTVEMKNYLQKMITDRDNSDLMSIFENDQQLKDAVAEYVEVSKNYAIRTGGDPDRPKSDALKEAEMILVMSCFKLLSKHARLIQESYEANIDSIFKIGA